jgi:hypothetical protein
VVALAVALDYVRGPATLERNQRERARALRRALTALGVTFVKAGQALSTRPDLLPAAYLEELSELQDGLPGFPDAEAFALIEAELGQPLESVCACHSPTWRDAARPHARWPADKRITPRPIAAASLGQVYRAELLGSGEQVAVKVQRCVSRGGAAERFCQSSLRAGARSAQPGLRRAAEVGHISDPLRRGAGGRARDIAEHQRRRSRGRLRLPRLPVSACACTWGMPPAVGR